MRIDTRQLRNLSTIIQEGTFARAATALNTSQPALSKSIQLLEQSVGAKLLDRGRYGAIPTPYGEALALRYRRIETELRYATYDIEELKDLSQGHVAIGATQTVAHYIVPAAVAALKAKKPKMAIKIVEDSAATLVKSLRDGLIDILVGPVYGDPLGPELAEEFLFDSRLVVIIRPGHPLSRRRKVTLSDLFYFQYVGVGGGNNTVDRQLQLLLKRSSLGGFEYAVETNSAQATKDLVRRSDYFALLPEGQVQLDLDANLLCVKELKTEANSWPFGVRWRNDHSLSPAMRAMIEELKVVSGRFAMRRLSPHRKRKN